MPIKLLGLIIYGLCFFGDNIFAIKCVTLKWLYTYTTYNI